MPSSQSGRSLLAEAGMVGREDVEVRRQGVVIRRPHVGAELRVQHQQRAARARPAGRACARRARRESRCGAPCAALLSAERQMQHSRAVRRARRRGCRAEEVAEHVGERGRLVEHDVMMRVGDLRRVGARVPRREELGKAAASTISLCAPRTARIGQRDRGQMRGQILRAGAGERAAVELERLCAVGRRG